MLLQSVIVCAGFGVMIVGLYDVLPSTDARNPDR